MLRVGIVANEPSGDLLGAGLIREIRRQVPDVQFEGVAGPLMQAEGCRSLFSMERLSVMGLVEVLKHLPELLTIRRQLVNYFLKSPPDIFIGVDAPDFNLALETKLKIAGIPTVHYVSPTVWAWRPKRVKKIRKAVNLVLSIFPFEEAFLRQHHVPVNYIGHPLADEIPVNNNQVNARMALGIERDQTVIALLPGSRLSEINVLGETFIHAARCCLEHNSALHFLVPLINQATFDAFKTILDETAPDLPLKLYIGRTREVLAASNLVLTASGTATLEALLHKRPMVVAYKVNALTYWLVKRFNLIKTPYIAMSNLLANEELAAEFIQDAATPEALSKTLLELLESPLRMEQIAHRYMELHQTLRLDSSRKAADAVLNLIIKKQ